MEVLFLTLTVVVVNLIVNLVQKRFIDKDLVKSLKEEMKKIQKQMKDVKQDTKKVNELLNRSLELQGKLMNHTMKPMMISFVVFIPAIYFVREFFSTVVLILPFTIPFVGSELGWFGIFILVGLVSNLIFRKIFDIGL